MKPVKLAAKDGGTFYDTDPADVYSGKYPLARFLYVYINKAPNKPLDPMVREFVKFMLSQRGPGVGDQGRLPADHAQRPRRPSWRRFSRTAVVA